MEIKLQLKVNVLTKKDHIPLAKNSVSLYHFSTLIKNSVSKQLFIFIYAFIFHFLQKIQKDETFNFIININVALLFIQNILVIKSVTCSQIASFISVQYALNVTLLE